MTVAVSGRAARRFVIRELPRVPLAAPVWTRAVARARATLPREVTATLKDLGPVSVAPVRLSFVPGATFDGEWFALDLGGRAARLAVDAPMALLLASSLMGAPRPAVIRPLGRAERGTLAAALVAFLEVADPGGAVRLSLDRGSPPLLGDALFIDLRVRTPSHAGWARLELPVAALRRPVLAVPVLNPAAVFSSIAVELDRTRLPAGEQVAAQPGDVVIFEGSSPLLADVPWTVQIRFGPCSLVGDLHPDGSVHRRGPLTHEPEPPMPSDMKTAPGGVPALTEETAAALAAAPVEVVAELGRITLRGDELVGLIEGGVLDLGPGRNTQVQLRVGGKLWAVGELVSIEDELGVRITEIVRG
jgi:flagellar motor switch protein FliN